MDDISREIIDKQGKLQWEIGDALGDRFGVIVGRQQYQKIRQEMSGAELITEGRGMKHGAFACVGDVWVFLDDSQDETALEIQTIDDIRAAFLAAAHQRWREKLGKTLEAGIQIAFRNQDISPNEVFKIAGVFAEWLVANCEPGTMFQNFEIKDGDMVGHMSTGGTLRVDMENLGWHFSSADAEV